MITKVAAALTLLAAFGVGCSGNPSRSDCTAIVDHLIEIFTTGKFAEDGTTKAPKEYNQAVDTWRRMLKDDKDVTHELLMQMCTTQISSGAVSCIRDAKNERELATCLGQ